LQQLKKRTNNNAPRTQTNNNNTQRTQTRAERKKIELAIANAKKDVDRSTSAQSSIPYLAMYPDGVCRVKEKLYSKTVEFYDVSYLLASQEEQTAVFEGLCDLYNYFDPSISVQETFINHIGSKATQSKLFDIPSADDDLEELREELRTILKTAHSKGNNGLVRQKYLTFAIEADNLKTARSRLGRIEIDILNLLRQIGAPSRALNGKQRLSVMHKIFHMGTQEKLNFDWNALPSSGLSTKDFIAPSSFYFGDGRTFRVGDKIGATSFLQIIAPELSDRILADYLEVDSNVIVNMHIQSIDQAKAVKMVKRKITDIDGMKINEVRPDRVMCEAV